MVPYCCHAAALMVPSIRPVRCGRRIDICPSNEVTHWSRRYVVMVLTRKAPRDCEAAAGRRAPTREPVGSASVARAMRFAVRLTL